MSSPLVLTSSQVTAIEAIDSLLHQAFLDGVVDGSNNPLNPPCPALPLYGTISSIVQEQAQAAIRSGFAALISGLNLPATGASGTIILAQLTGPGSAGSITVVNGIITGFVNPT